MLFLQLSWEIFCTEYLWSIYLVIHGIFASVFRLDGIVEENGLWQWLLLRDSSPITNRTASKLYGHYQKCVSTGRRENSCSLSPSDCCSHVYSFSLAVKFGCSNWFEGLGESRLWLMEAFAGVTKLCCSGWMQLQKTQSSGLQVRVG